VRRWQVNVSKSEFVKRGAGGKGGGAGAAKEESKSS
jgi:hypothetical protein